MYRWCIRPAIVPADQFQAIAQWFGDASRGAHGRVYDGGSLGQSDEEVQRVVDAVARFLPAIEGVPVREVRRGRLPIPKDGPPDSRIFSTGSKSLFVCDT